VTKNCHECEGAKIVKGLDDLTVYVEKGMSTGHEIVTLILILIIFLNKNK